MYRIRMYRTNSKFPLEDILKPDPVVVVVGTDLLPERQVVEEDDHLLLGVVVAAVGTLREGPLDSHLFLMD